MSYRDDQETLSTRREELRAELDETTRKADELRQEVERGERVARELAEVESRLEKRGALRRSPLEDVRVASPCSASWDAMIGDERVRFCAQCQKNVYDLSALAREEAEQLLAAHEGTLCVRLYRRADGTVLTTDCPEGRRKKRVRLTVLSVAGAGAMAAAAVTAWSRSTSPIGATEVTLGVMESTPRDHLVEVPLSPRRDPSIVAIFWRDQRGHGEPPRRLVVHSDRRVVREIDAPSQRTVIGEAHLSAEEAEALFGMATRFRPRATGIVSEHADSAVMGGFDLHGTGAAEMTPQDLAQLRFLGDVLDARLSR